jgi:trehalose 6-phosphate synthase
MPLIDRYLRDRTLILLSNREPYEHSYRKGEITIRQPPGGLVSALDPTMQHTHGTWVAWGSGSADRATADEEGRLQVPPDDPSYTLRRVWLDEDDIEGYYLGFANSVLWPACHMLVQHLEFRVESWQRYQDVNQRFADAVADEARRADGAPMVWIQDYHFALVASQLREELPDIFIHQFWHIPFPPLDILGLLPTSVVETLLRGMLGNDLIEFHTRRYAMNFLSCVEYFLPEAQVRRSSLTVQVGRRTVSLGVFPISIDVELYETLASTPEADQRVRELRDRYARGGKQLGISVDRIDYTKGIPERLKALDLLWERFPELRQRFTVILVATPSRTDLDAYRHLEADVIGTVAEINMRYGIGDWTPIVLVHENVNAELLASIYRAGDLCMVSSLQDGMNLVAKEYIACQTDEHGVLVLSRFTGAAEAIDGALLINPFNVDGFVAGIREALDMPRVERRRRMQRMRVQLHDTTIFDWLSAILSRASDLMGDRPAPRRGRADLDDEDDAEAAGAGAGSSRPDLSGPPAAKRPLGAQIRDFDQRARS